MMPTHEPGVPARAPAGGRTGRRGAGAGRGSPRRRSRWLVASRSGRPQATVVVLARGKEEHVRASLDSVRDQPLARLEIVVVVMDERLQPLADRAAAEDWRVRAVESYGSDWARARQFGAVAARTDWLLFLSPRQLLLPGAVTALLEARGERRTVVIGQVEDPETSWARLPLLGRLLVPAELWGGALDDGEQDGQTVAVVLVADTYADGSHSYAEARVPVLRDGVREDAPVRTGRGPGTPAVRSGRPGQVDDRVPRPGRARGGTIGAGDRRTRPGPAALRAGCRALRRAAVGPPVQPRRGDGRDRRGPGAGRRPGGGPGGALAGCRRTPRGAHRVRRGTTVRGRSSSPPRWRTAGCWPSSTPHRRTSRGRCSRSLLPRPRCGRGCSAPGSRATSCTSSCSSACAGCRPSHPW